MRIRNIKPEFWRHRMHRRLSESAALVALALLNVADDEGRFEADPELIKNAVFPYRTLTKPLAECLAELESFEWIQLYDAKYQGEKVRIGAIRTFNKHQRFSHPQRSRLPAPEPNRSDSRAAPEPNRSDSRAALEQHQNDSRELLETDWSGSSATLTGSGIRDQGSGIRGLPPFPPKGGTAGDAPETTSQVKLRFDLATTCVDYLNSQAGTKFPATHAVLHQVAARLREAGNDLEAVKRMIERQVKLWKNDARMKAYLRPATLFDEEKFPSYFGQREQPAQALRPEERRRELQRLIDESPANRQSIFHKNDATEMQREQLAACRRELRELDKNVAEPEAVS